MQPLVENACNGVAVRGQHQGVAIGRALGDRGGAGNARAVLDDDLLFPLFAQFVGDRARQQIGGAAGRERHDDAHDLVRITLLRLRADIRQDECGGCEQRQAYPRHQACPRHQVLLVPGYAAGSRPFYQVMKFPDMEVIDLLVAADRPNFTCSKELPLPMRTEQARPVRLEDYRPPDWLVDPVDLDISLHPTATHGARDA